MSEEPDRDELIAELAELENQFEDRRMLMISERVASIIGKNPGLNLSGGR